MKVNAAEVKGVFDHCFKAMLDNYFKTPKSPGSTNLNFETPARAAHELTKAYINKLKELGGDGDLGPLDPRDGDNPYDVNAVGGNIWGTRCRKVGDTPFDGRTWCRFHVRKEMLGKDGFSCGPW